MKKNSNLISEIDLSSPVEICIEVKGLLDNTMSEVLGGLSIRNNIISDKISISYIEGIVTDQAALIGIINTLFNMRFPIINVKMNNN
jgi:hypothetical protein